MQLQDYKSVVFIEVFKSIRFYIYYGNHVWCTWLYISSRYLEFFSSICSIFQFTMRCRSKANFISFSFSSIVCFILSYCKITVIQSTDFRGWFVIHSFIVAGAIKQHITTGDFVLGLPCNLLEFDSNLVSTM